MLHVPYKGISQSVNDLLSGIVDVSIEGIASVLPHIQSGKLRAVATMTAEPIPSLPQVPTARSLGYSDLYVSGLQFIGVPKATPRETVDRINQAFRNVLLNDEVRARLAGQGSTPYYASQEESAHKVKAAYESWAKIIKTADVKIN